MDHRLRAICDLGIPQARREAGLRAYDGRLQDLSPAGVRSALARLGGHPAYDDRHDEAQATAAEEAAGVRFGELELHRINPLPHFDNLDLTCYEGVGAGHGGPGRTEARAEHVRRWPDGVDMALEALDRMPAPVARASLPAARGLAAQLRPDESAARAALDRLVDHLARTAAHGPPSAALGGRALARLMSAAEALPFDQGALARRADAERVRLRARLSEACHHVDPASTVEETMRALLVEHPPAHELVAAAEKLVGEVIAWTVERDLVPWTDGECLVGTVPESQPWQVATMTSAGPHEPDGPGWFRVNPGDPSWPDHERDEWLRHYGPAMLPNIAIHEVAPGHFAHGRALRRAGSEVRRTVLSEGFTEGWAHYCEELALDEGFRSGDPRFAIAVIRDALLRVTRLACAIGVHEGSMTLDEAAQRYADDAFVEGRAARAAVDRLVLNPEAGHYTWGKWAVLDLRDRARSAWGPAFTLPRFHRALLGLGAPALGLMETVLS